LERAIAEVMRLVTERPEPVPTPGPRPERGVKAPAWAAQVPAEAGGAVSLAPGRPGQTE